MNAYLNYSLFSHRLFATDGYGLIGLVVGFRPRDLVFVEEYLSPIYMVVLQLMTITSTHNKAQADKAGVTFQDITRAVRKSPSHWSTKPRNAVINNEDNVPNNSSDHVAEDKDTEGTGALRLSKCPLLRTLTLSFCRLENVFEGVAPLRAKVTVGSMISAPRSTLDIR